MQGDRHLPQAAAVPHLPHPSSLTPTSECQQRCEHSYQDSGVEYFLWANTCGKFSTTDLRLTARFVQRQPAVRMNRLLFH